LEDPSVGTAESGNAHVGTAALGCPVERSSTVFFGGSFQTDSAILPLMPVKWPRKPNIAIVGAGNLARALAVSLRAAGYRIDLIISRRRAASLQRARRLARAVGASAVAASRTQIQAELVWFCVPDGAIATAAQSLLGAADWKGKVALHSSGASTSDELGVLQARGAAVGSAHPLMTFVRGSIPHLVEVPFAIEGDRKAARAARAMVDDLRGRAFTIRKQDKEAYHAWGMFVSPLLTALLAASEDVAAAAGVSGKAARQRVLPILKQTLANYARLGAAGSFSGPIARGDVDTVRKHLNALRGIPAARDVYITLARAALRTLPSKNRAALEKILES
jgi:predicted short-subunit dehydrogenase-like oxidoreductase (DUF2520 family)